MGKKMVESIQRASKIAVIYTLKSVIGLVFHALMLLAGLFGREKDIPRRIYISINNLLTRYSLERKSSAKILILLPQCMQNKDCKCNISEGIDNCLRCGRCKVGEVADISERCGIRTVVAKGGTAARNTVKEFKPDFILAIACERELVSGIGDVGKIPVIGVVNQRPNGYCSNTTVDMVLLKKILRELETRYVMQDKKMQDSSKGVEVLCEGTNDVACSTGQKNV